MNEPKREGEAKRRELPPGYRLVRHPRTKYKFVQTPWNKLVPNQGTLPNGDGVGPDTATEEAVVRDFFIWYDKQPENKR